MRGKHKSVPNSFNMKLELSLFDQFKLKGAKIWTQTFLPLYLFLFGDKYKPAADLFADAAVSENQIINFT